jgi:hypothetical protein
VYKVTEEHFSMAERLIARHSFSVTQLPLAGGFGRSGGSTEILLSKFAGTPNSSRTRACRTAVCGFQGMGISVPK